MSFADGERVQVIHSMYPDKPIGTVRLRDGSPRNWVYVALDGPTRAAGGYLVRWSIEIDAAFVRKIFS